MYVSSIQILAKSVLKVRYLGLPQIQSKLRKYSRLGAIFVAFDAGFLYLLGK